MTCSTNPTAGCARHAGHGHRDRLVRPAAVTVTVGAAVARGEQSAARTDRHDPRVGGLVGGGAGEVVGPVAGAGGDDELGAGEVAIQGDGRRRNLEVGRRNGGAQQTSNEEGRESECKSVASGSAGGEPGRESVGETGRRPGWRVSTRIRDEGGGGQLNRGRAGIPAGRGSGYASGRATTPGVADDRGRVVGLQGARPADTFAQTRVARARRSDEAAVLVPAVCGRRTIGELVRPAAGRSRRRSGYADGRRQPESIGRMRERCHAAARQGPMTDLVVAAITPLAYSPTYAAEWWSSDMGTCTGSGAGSTRYLRVVRPRC